MIKLKDTNYPNTVCENAEIIDEYNLGARTMADYAIKQFIELCKVPHPSGSCEKMRQYLVQWGKDHGANIVCDSGNVIMDIEASKGCENIPKVIFQSHFDMVSVGSNDNINFDPLTSPIEPIFDKKSGVLHTGWRSTLGADDGHGVAVSLAMILLHNNKEINFEHGPLRFIFTYDEETSQEGAENITASDLDANFLINMDSIYVGEIITSSAGGFSGNILKKLDFVYAGDNSSLISIDLTGLCGGHSGEDINKNRANAVVILLDYLGILIENDIVFNIKYVKSGERLNAIADNLILKFVVDKKNCDKAISLWKSVIEKAITTYSDGKSLIFNIDIDNNFKGEVVKASDSEEIFNFLNKIPIGMIESAENGFTITSNNVGICNIDKDLFSAEILFRSSLQNKIHSAIKSTVILCNNYDFDLTVSALYPAWQSMQNSKLENLFLQAFKDVANIEARAVGIHAGLEVGNFAITKSGINIVSIGCDVIHEHNIKETLFTKSIPVYCATIMYVLKHLT